jgi:hypothetical protein
MVWERGSNGGALFEWSAVTRARQRRAWLRRALAIGAFAELLFPNQASADESNAGGGIHLELAIERGGKLGFGWGVDLYATRVFDSGGFCSSEARSAVGPLVQFGMIGGHAPRVVLAGYAGKESTRVGPAIGGELGGTLRFGPEGGFGIHTAFVPSFAFLSIYGRAEWLLGERGVGAGFRYPTPFGETVMCAEGRTLRDGTGRAVQGAASISQRSKRAQHENDTGRAPLARCLAPDLAAAAFSRDAQAELESVPAFVQLAFELAFLGAPAALLDAALASAEQELGHAALMAALAERCAEVQVRPRCPAHAPRPPLAGTAGLARLAVESYVDGCIGEGIAAARAAEGARTAKDPVLASARRRIARDESAHAALGWSIVRYALSAGGAPVAEALAQARAIPFASEGGQDDPPADWEALGRVRRPRAESLSAEHAARCQAKLERLLVLHG